MDSFLAFWFAAWVFALWYIGFGHNLRLAIAPLTAPSQAARDMAESFRTAQIVKRDLGGGISFFSVQHNNKVLECSWYSGGAFRELYFNGNGVPLSKGDKYFIYAAARKRARDDMMLQVKAMERTPPPDPSP